VRLFWFATLMLVATSLSGNEIYRSVDKDGNLIYSDRPQGADAEPILLAAPRPPTRPPASESRTGQPEPPSPEPLMAEIEREPTADERAQICLAARERLELYTSARRLFRNTQDGEREYLDSDEMDAARASAAADVQTWCS
jgi:hypothetical protein